MSQSQGHSGALSVGGRDRLGKFIAVHPINTHRRPTRATEPATDVECAAPAKRDSGLGRAAAKPATRATGLYGRRPRAPVIRARQHGPDLSDAGRDRARADDWQRQ